MVGSRWTSFKNMSPKSEENKPSLTTDKKDNKDTYNPFGILLPNWAFGLIPSGTWAPRCSRWMNLTVIIIFIIMSDYLIRSHLFNYVCSAVRTWNIITSSLSWGDIQYSNSSMLTPLYALHLSSQPLQTTSNIYTSISPLCLSLVVSFYISAPSPALTYIMHS